MKKLDFNKTVYELAKEYPEFTEIMAQIGFKEITKKAMLNSAGKIMTVPKGAKMKGIDINNIVKAFEEHGFEVVGYEKEDSAVLKEAENNLEINNEISNTEKLKSYLKRLNNGDDLETVRADFVKNFKDVDPSEIMNAEQEMINDGEPLESVQKLCDVHSALFHGATSEEKIANAEIAALSLMREKQQKSYDGKTAAAARLTAVIGHPLNTFTKENNNLSSYIENIREEIKNNADVSGTLAKIREVAVHYAKKGDLLYPLLKLRYGISGPSDVMWSVDDEIRDELASLSKENNRDEKWTLRLENVIQRAQEMIYKETNILFPICAVNFTDDEWKSIYRDSKDYADCLGVEKTLWNEGENYEKKLPSIDGEVVMPGGHMTVKQLTALLNTLPFEITFVDDKNINRYFNEGPKVFKRPEAAIDREVFSCHPPKVEAMVRQILSDFREGRRDVVPVWMDKNGKTFLVRYMAVRDKEKNYVGTIELVQDMEFAKEHFKKES